MEIYIRVDDDGFGDRAWYYHGDGESFLTEHFETMEGDIALNPAKTVAEAKRWMREAKSLMRFDGASGKVTASAWRFVRGKLTETKFTRDGKIKK